MRMLTNNNPQQNVLYRSDQRIANQLVTNTMVLSYPIPQGCWQKRALALSATTVPTNDDNSRDIIKLDASLLESIETLSQTWRDTPLLNPTLHLTCWRVSNQNNQALQMLIESDLTKPYLATQMTLWNHVKRNRKVRNVYNDPDERYPDHKLVLLSPDTPPVDQLPENVQQLLRDNDVQTTDSDRGMALTFTHQLRPCDFQAWYILETLLPKHLHPPPTSFETIGHVAHLNLKEPYLPYGNLIGHVLLETLPSLGTVINKVGQVSGPYRTYSYQVLADRSKSDARSGNSNDNSNGKGNTVVSLTEWGIGLQFDVCNVYWSSRLREERRRLIETEFKKGQWIADVFCGVGALCLQAARHKKCIITANDWNPQAIEALKINAKENKLQDSFYQVSCGDAYEFLTGLGLAQQTMDKSLPSHLPHHVVMNYPLQAASFLGALRWWPVVKRKNKTALKNNVVVPRVHVYIFARESKDKNASTLSAEELAVNEVASYLLPSFPGQDNSTRWSELDSFFGCNVSVQNVRDVAPGKVVLCVSFSATERLLRYMQGSYDE